MLHPEDGLEMEEAGQARQESKQEGLQFPAHTQGAFGVEVTSQLSRPEVRGLA